MTARSALGLFQDAFPGLYKSARNDSTEAGGETRVATGDDASQQPEQPGRDQYQTRIQAIAARFDAAEATAKDLQGYLEASQKEARQSEYAALLKADEDYTPNWRNAGLPAKPSHLQLNAQSMHTGRLVDPSTIAAAHDAHVTKEVLQPPEVFVYNDTTLDPHYLASTNNLRVRQAMGTARSQRVAAASTSSRTWHTLSQPELDEKLLQSEARRKQWRLQMDPGRMEAEKRIIKSMTHKLTFLRNPRYPLPPQVRQLMASAAAAADEEAEKHGVTIRRGPSPMKAHLTARPEQVFLPEPAEVVFLDYRIGASHVQVVQLRNLTNMMQSLRVLPSSSQYFHVSLPRYPGQASGAVAPGMHAEVTVQFCPDSLADYEDSFVVDTATNRFSVGLAARRPPPVLTLDEVIGVGEVVVGNRQVVEVQFSNLGGSGRFRIVPQALWPDRLQDALKDTALLGDCFQVAPAFLDLPRGSQGQLQVCFEPQGLGEVREGFVMVCDNCQAKSFTVAGTGIDVDVRVTGVDGEDVTPGQLGSPLWLGQVVPGACSRRSLRIKNTTTLPFPFIWTFSALPCTPHQAPTTLQPHPADSTPHATAPQPSNAAHPQQQQFGPQGTPPAGGPGQELDLVRLGLQQQECFSIHPMSGVLLFGEEADFVVTFFPAKLARFSAWAQLWVDKSTPDQRAAAGTAPEADLLVLEVGMEGTAAPSKLRLSPARMDVPGALCPGEAATRQLLLHNPTDAPTGYRFKGGNCVQVKPGTGVVPPCSTIQLQVRILGTEVGPIRETLECSVEHGATELLEVRASVTHPRVDIVAGELDFGRVYSHGTETRHMTLWNRCSTSQAAFQIQEMTTDLRPASGTPQQCLSFTPEAGLLAPGQQLQVLVSFQSGTDGSHHRIVQVLGPGPADDSMRCLKAFANVITPRLLLSQCKVELGHSFRGVPLEHPLTLRNPTHLPATFTFLPDALGDSEALEAAVEPASGTLEPGQLLPLTVKLLPRLPGPATLVIECSVPGAAAPLALLLHTTIHDLEVTYRILTPEQHAAQNPPPPLPLPPPSPTTKPRRAHSPHPNTARHPTSTPSLQTSPPTSPSVSPGSCSSRSPTTPPSPPPSPHGSTPSPRPQRCSGAPPPQTRAPGRAQPPLWARR